MFGPQSYTFRAYRLQNLVETFDSQNEKEEEQRLKDKKRKSFRMSKPTTVETNFLGWECVSIKLENRTIDFIIKDP